MKITRRKLFVYGGAAWTGAIISNRTLEAKEARSLLISSLDTSPSKTLSRRELSTKYWNHFWEKFDPTLSDAVSSIVGQISSAEIHVKELTKDVKKGITDPSDAKAEITRVRADAYLSPVNWIIMKAFRSMLDGLPIDQLMGPLAGNTFKTLIPFHLQTALCRFKNTLTQWLIDGELDFKRLPWKEIPGELLGSLNETAKEITIENGVTQLPAWKMGLILNGLSLASAVYGLPASVSKTLAFPARQMIVGADQIRKAVDSFHEAHQERDPVDKRIIARGIFGRELREEEIVRWNCIQDDQRFKDVRSSIEQAQANFITWPGLSLIQAGVFPLIKTEPELPPLANRNKIEFLTSLFHLGAFLLVKPGARKLSDYFRKKPDSRVSKLFLELMIPSEYLQYLDQEGKSTNLGKSQY